MLFHTPIPQGPTENQRRVASLLNNGDLDALLGVDGPPASALRPRTQEEIEATARAEARTWRMAVVRHKVKRKIIFSDGENSEESEEEEVEKEAPKAEAAGGGGF